MTQATIEILLAQAASSIEVAAGLVGPPGPAGVGVPAGGGIGAVLRKASAANYDTAWLEPGFASFSDTTIQTQTTINTAKAVTFNTTEYAHGVHIDPLNPSHVVVESPGLYNFEFSLQVQMTGGGGSTADLWIWPRVNGADVPRSNSHLTCHGGETNVPAWNFDLLMNAGDYFQLMWAAASLAITLDADPAPAFGPAVPSAILTVTKTHQD